MIAQGFLLHNLIEPMHKLCRAQLEAAALFDFYRLPECFSGHRRDEAHPFPSLCPAANWPQAWSSAAVLALLEALLGLFPYAPLNTLFVDPHLPEWLPELTLDNLHVGPAAATIRFSRQDDGSTHIERSL
jgi:glycogen debranching enzyme